MTEGFLLLNEVVKDRRTNPVEGSYTCYLFQQGLNKILKKCGEECSEMMIAAKDGNKEELKEEICDLFYHISVLMVEKDIEPGEIDKILFERSQKIGNLKPVHKGDRNS